MRARKGKTKGANIYTKRFAANMYTKANDMRQSMGNRAMVKTCNYTYDSQRHALDNMHL